MGDDAVTSVGDKIAAENASWSFTGLSAEFDEHVRKSVPLYTQGHDLVCRAADHFLLDGSLCYELGAATGALTQKLAERNAGKDVRFVGIDLESDMVAAANERCSHLDQVTFEVGDLLETNLEPADVIISYYTMQFVRPRERQRAFDRIFESLNWGGALFLFEKVRAPDARFQDIITSVYTDYKLEVGYQPDEIVAKARSLKGVLEPFSTAGNLGLLERAGFADVMTIFKYACFEGFLAIK